MSSYLFTSESVSEGHPDKMADQISDAVLDAILTQDPKARVACETLVKTGAAIVAGEITTSAWVDIESLARGVINDIGYDNSNVGFDGHTCAIINMIGKQSPDISQAEHAFKLIPSVVRAARVLGLDRNAAAISANQAVAKLTGANVMRLLVDILSGLKAGDSYGAQARH